MATQQTGAEAPGASEGSGPESTAQESAASQAAAAAEEASAKPDLDETKRKFREALERKRREHATAEGVDHTGKVHGAHGPAASRRAFRRKSG